MQGYRIGQKVAEKLIPIIVNDYDDAIYIDINDTTFVNKVINLYQWFDRAKKRALELSDDYEKAITDLGVTDIDEKEPPIEVLETYKEYNAKVINLHKEICEQFDLVFGDGTMRKYFRKLYEAYGDSFVPDDRCINDFVDEITPVLEQLFEVRRGNIKNNYVKKTKTGKHGKSKSELINSFIERKHATSHGDVNV